MKKKIVAILLASTMALSLSACGGSGSDSSNSNTQAEKTTKSSDSSDKNSFDQETTDENEASDSSTESNENTDSFSPIGDSLAIDFDITAEPTDFPKDTTGKWRKTMIAESGIEFQNYALNYYKKYFKSNDEVHVIYNFSTRTVTCITCMGNLLSVRVMDYVDKEEHDASAACGGTLLAEYQVNIETGAIEKIQ